MELEEFKSSLVDIWQIYDDFQVSVIPSRLEEIVYETIIDYADMVSDGNGILLLEYVSSHTPTLDKLTEEEIELYELIFSNEE